MVINILFTDSKGRQRYGLYCRTRAKYNVVVLIDPRTDLYKGKPKGYKTYEEARQSVDRIAQVLSCSKTVVFSMQDGEEQVSVKAISIIGIKPM